MNDVSLIDLWLPIGIAAVVVFIASFLAWMVLPHHRKEVAELPDEAALFAALRAMNAAPGRHIFPYCDDPSKFKDEAFVQQWKASPHGVLTLWSGPPQMGRNLGLTFGFYVLVSLFVAYLSTMAALPPAPTFMQVFRFTATAAVAMYALGPLVNVIWFDKSMRGMINGLADNVVYGLLTGAIFAALWPATDVSL